jgi:hypothetical protein
MEKTLLERKMKKLLGILAILAWAVFFYGQPARANLVVNGSFEDTTGFVANADGYMSLPAASTTMTGWTVTTAEIAWVGPTFAGQFSALDGSYCLDLTGAHDSLPFGAVQQTISTIPGGQYRLSFYLGSSAAYGLPSAITASADSTTQTFTSTNTASNNVWEHYSMIFTASSNATVISLAGVEGRYYVGLDDVCVTPVPIPGAVWLLGSGLLCFTPIRRRLKA